jgi:hypothetical protein
MALGLAVATSAQAQKPQRFQAQLQPVNAGGVPVVSNAEGRAEAEVVDGGTAVAFKVKVAGIENLLMAHIHVKTPADAGPVNINESAGPIAYWFTGGPPAGTTLTERLDGSLAEGFIVTDGSLVSWEPANPLDGTVAGLIEAIEQGRASVVVHTDDLNPDTPTGQPGDSRAGELRGTLALPGGL